MNAATGKYEKQRAEKEGRLKTADCGVTYSYDGSGTRYSVITVWRGRGYKPVAHYAVRDEDHAMKVVESEVASAKASAELKARMKAERAAQLKETKTKMKVGALLSYSWGYEQTQVEFFQVTKVTGSTVWLRPISAESVEETSWASDRVRPIRDAFCGPEFKKRINDYGVSFEHGCGRLIEDESRTFHRSWYA